jgi:hypothetical protein
MKKILRFVGKVLTAGLFVYQDEILEKIEKEINSIRSDISKREFTKKIKAILSKVESLKNKDIKRKVADFINRNNTFYINVRFDEPQNKFIIKADAKD